MPRIKQALPPIHLVKSYFNYNPETGLFTRLCQVGKGKIGSIAGTVSCGYIAIGIDYTLYRAHRLAWLYMTGDDPGQLEIDHINGKRVDNRWCNLRLATLSQNRCNAPLRKSNTTGWKGVYLSKERNSYRAEICFENIKYHLGRFHTAEEAGAAYLKAAARLHKEFQNFTS